MATNKSTRAVTQIPARFAYQSYFDSGLLQGAILNQAQGSPIVASTRRVAQTPGIGVALHPSSESPIAIRFRGGQADSAEVILTPGQKINVGTFETFEWGLPFGWLGGGTSVLYVLHNPGASVDFQASPAAPILYHRERIAIVADPGVIRTPNWPNAFPWDNAINGADANPQGGTAVININPTHTMFRLRSLIAAPTVLTAGFWGMDSFDTGADGLTISLVDVTAFDLPFPAASGGGFPLAWIQNELSLLAGPAAHIAIVDLNAGNPLAGSFIDVLRYGTLD